MALYSRRLNFHRGTVLPRRLVEPKTEASAATIGVSPAVIARILRLKTLTVEVRAGSGARKYKLVKSDGPDDLVFQSVQTGKPMNDQNVLKRHFQPAARTLGLPFVNWRCSAHFACNLAGSGWGRPEIGPRADAAFAHLDDDGYLRADCSGRAAASDSRSCRSLRNLNPVPLLFQSDGSLEC